jgi:hypothetical protein
MTVCSKLGVRLSDVFRAAEDAAVPLPVAPRTGNFHLLLSGSQDAGATPSVSSPDQPDASIAR